MKNYTEDHHSRISRDLQILERYLNIGQIMMAVGLGGILILIFL